MEGKDPKEISIEVKVAPGKTTAITCPKCHKGYGGWWVENNIGKETTCDCGQRLKLV